MLKGRGRDPRGAFSPAPAQVPLRAQVQAQSRHVPNTAAHPTIRTSTQPRAPLARPEPDYEVVEFSSDQYVNAKLQPPPPPPPRPPTGHPAEAASCGLCGGGGARVRCAECGRRALCASCDDMYHRHPKRRHHQRQALSLHQVREERPPLPPKGTPPVPPPRRHKMSGDRMSASPRPPSADFRNAGLSQSTVAVNQTMTSGRAPPQHAQQLAAHLRGQALGSVPHLHHSVPHASHTLGHLPGWQRPRTSLPGFNMSPNVTMAPEPWEAAEAMAGHNWGRPLRRGASVLELGGAGAMPPGVGAPNGACAGCPQCAPGWRYGSCASLDQQPWAGAWPPSCCVPPHAHAHSPAHAHAHAHPHAHAPYTPQPYRRGLTESRAASRVGSRAGSRAASPANSVRSRTSRRHKPRSPSPPLPSSDADSESDGGDTTLPQEPVSKPEMNNTREAVVPNAAWQCEHCTFVNEAGGRVCAVCCRTPSSAPVILAHESPGSPVPEMQSINESARGIERLRLADNPTPEPQSTRVHHNGDTKARSVKEQKVEMPKKDRISTGCGPSPPREETKRLQNRLSTPTHGQTEPRTRHDMAVGSSPPKEYHNSHISSINEPEAKNDRPVRHSISVGPSPPRENSVRQSPIPKKSAGTSPPRERDNGSERRSTTVQRNNVSNTGTSPPPQSISTQTYEVPSTWERAPSAARSRSRRRLRDDTRRERSHSRHSLSSDTRESERSARTTGGRWEWRESREARDSSPGGEWSGSERPRLARRASHLDLRRDRRPHQRRNNLYRSEAASPEPTRAMSMEALATDAHTAAATRGLELARLMADAERLGFNAAEVAAALAQSPAAPLSWLRSRWAGLCAGVRAAAARLAPAAPVSEHDARRALAASRGAMWPAVTHCVDKYRRQREAVTSAEGGLRGRVWGSPAGADDDAAPPQRAEDSSDEFDGPPPTPYRDDWPYLPPEPMGRPGSVRDAWDVPPPDPDYREVAGDVALELSRLLAHAGVPAIGDDLLLKGLLTHAPQLNLPGNGAVLGSKPNSNDFIQSEKDFIDAYNALTRSTPLPSVDDQKSPAQPVLNSENKRDTYDVIEHDPHSNMKNDTNDIHVDNNIQINHTSGETGDILNISSQSNTNTSDKQFEVISNNEILNQNDNVPEEAPVKHLNEEKNEQISNEFSNIKISNSTEKVQNDIEPELTVAKDVLLENGSEVVLNTSQIVLTVNKTVDMSIEENVDEIAFNYVPDRSSNLSDIVDNTQKLIQQMKDEINSDINSIDDRTISQSEADSSSQSDLSSEHESSYSDTEDKETDNVSSDAESGSSSSDDEASRLHERRPTIIQRTSSDENDQFEEAMDHIEDQIEDFRTTNIEILDSIARSLQEEQNLSIVNIEPIITKSEDVNNNLFAEVNSFEEIYAQLNTNKKDTNSQIDVSNTQDQTSAANLPSQISAPINYVTKQFITVETYEASNPIMLIINENNTTSLNAVIGNIENSNMSVPTKNNLEITAEDSLLNKNVTEITEALPESISSLEEGSLDNEQDHNSIGGNNSLTRVDVEVIHNNTETITVVENISNEVESKQNIELKTDAFVNEEEIPNNVPESSNNSVETAVVIERKKSPSKSPPKSLPNGNTNKTPPANKSSIPKLVKVVPNSKQKGDKSSPKVLASKVPVRRGSLKQYPAPAPPKSHFGNVQSGHVKQLQTRLFNNKFPKTVVKIPEVMEVKPSTSTIHKKKPAPPPPVEQKRVSPIKVSLPKEKKNHFFRESCRTEDEWTESDSESQEAPRRVTEEETPGRPSSPPLPPTVRRVSGQIIDLATVRLPEGSPERQARMLLAEGAAESWAQARLAVQLVAGGADAAAALLAALECADMDAALAYLHQDCHLCASRLPEHEMVSMLRCTHRCCRECARLYFTVQITERSIVDCACPFCKEPALEDMPDDDWLDYFAHLDILLKTLLDAEVHELFQRKLRDRTLARDPNFRWCVECSSGFFVHPKQKKIRCPECRSVTCAKCRKTWSVNHEGVTCEQYQEWLDDNDPERSLAAVQQHLRENGLECPRCHFKYSLSRGGCMHFTCTQCKFEFCYGCGKPFMMGARCGLSEYCARLGLHAHHPRNCLFYLRDKEPHELQTLLQMNNVSYETEAPEGSSGRCPIQLQRETPAGLVDGVCNAEAPPKHAGMCKPHYVEHLAARARTLDPIPIMDVAELVAELRRRALPLPERGPWDTDPIYAGMCAEIVKEKIPLD